VCMQCVRSERVKGVSGRGDATSGGNGV
jgi:hypothetical protein